VASTSPAADDPETGVRGPTAFATTHWSLIVRAADAGTAEGRAALAELYRIYWYPLYGFARRRGLAPADAEDLTPGVLADLLARGAVARADAAYSSGGGVMFVSWYENPFHWPQTCA
jgi:RNA polymerase sigma-70 factor (ECF subfamily)